MNVLVVGNGGREHALAWRLRQSPSVATVYVAPGNGGTARDARLVSLPQLSATDVVGIRQWAQANSIGLVVVGPEAPLAAGLVDELRAHGVPVFGPTQAAAQLESSKAFSKAFMARHGIPTAAYDTFTDAALAHAYIDRMGAPIVVKADGLAAGKGVVVAMTLAEAHEAVDFMLGSDESGNKFGVQHNAGGARVVIEEFLQGEEASFIVVCDGTTVLPLATSQDHKRLLDADQGPNTGGMGAYSPAPVVTPAIHDRAMQEVILPTVAGMAADGIPYSGFLYAGLMITPDGAVKTLEFNCRMGDPETQPIMMRLQSDLAAVLLDAAHQRLAGTELSWDSRCALGVVLAADGYPLTPRKGDAITALPVDTPDAVVFHAGTTLVDDTLQTSGGRVLCATALGDSVKDAQSRAYALVDQVTFAGMQFRKDIGFRAL
ncbi:MAG TPA: phosphoribosylamine--glycine ligase [Burkholderiaceae bacterium]|nr:phosphoribosylamine--glycine ligase [Burkholderiaceae bacterium]